MRAASKEDTSQPRRKYNAIYKMRKLSNLNFLQTNEHIMFAEDIQFKCS
jgi:hypothetical protein